MATSASHTDKPPSYDVSKSVSTSTEDPPPYVSLYGRIQRVKTESENPLDFITKFCDVLCVSVFAIIALMSMLTVPITMVVIGAVNVNNCLIEPLIPIWLIVYGSVATLSLSISIATRIYVLHRRKTDENYKLTKFSNLKNLFDVFLFAWLICGSIWVYRSYDAMDSSSVLLCNKTCYYLAFSFITVLWIVIGLLCSCCVCVIPVLCLACLCANKVNPEPQ